MAIITFMSDFGHRDHYVAAVKAKILSINPNINIVDISHSIEQFNIPHAAFVLRSVFRDFPKGTVHLVSVNAPGGEKDKMIAIKLEEHFFVGVDNGLFSLLSEKDPVVIELRPDANFSPVFPERTVLASAAVSLASGISIYNLGKQQGGVRKMLNRQLKVTSGQLSGHIVHVDNYGNLITNISKEMFEGIRDGRNFIIHFGMEKMDSIAESYDGVDNGDCLILFNSIGMMEIAISQGNAAQLLGLGFDSAVTISFV
ncbi:MAG: SAM-dependent chlorinase/fluorinase [Cytophagaceae bacterium]|nr:SAM-dependent chlorinase/fluorinase [Cytophagaceae bacterium]